MDTDKWLGGLALAALSGLTFLAYKHPKAFEKLFKAIMLLIIVTFLMAISWNISSDVAIQTIIKLLPDDKHEEAFQLANSMTLHSWKFYVGYAVIYFYIIFLRFFLPDLLREDQPPKKQGD